MLFKAKEWKPLRIHFQIWVLILNASVDLREWNCGTNPRKQANCYLWICVIRLVTWIRMFMFLRIFFKPRAVFWDFCLLFFLQIYIGYPGYPSEASREFHPVYSCPSRSHPVWCESWSHNGGGSSRHWEDWHGGAGAFRCARAFRTVF